jgi:hypothetical protein
LELATEREDVLADVVLPTSIERRGQVVADVDVRMAQRRPDYGRPRQPAHALLAADPAMSSRYWGGG